MIWHGQQRDIYIFYNYFMCYVKLFITTMVLHILIFNKNGSHVDGSVFCNWKCCSYYWTLRWFFMARLKDHGVDIFAMSLIICEQKYILGSTMCIYINFSLWFDKFHFPMTLWLFALGIYLGIWICRISSSATLMLYVTHYKMW